MALTREQRRQIVELAYKEAEAGRSLFKPKAKPEPQKSKADVEAQVYAKAKQLGGML